MDSYPTLPHQSRPPALLLFMDRPTVSSKCPLAGVNNPQAGPSRNDGENSILYGFEFWTCYAANLLFIISTTILYRYSDFVFHHGGTEFQLGLIIGVGMLGALLFRGFQGAAIDRYGARAVWLLSLALYATSLLLHLMVNDVNTVTAFLIRGMTAAGLAGTFCATITYVSVRAPAQRMPELIGVMSSSGFFGIALGPLLADMIVSGKEISHAQIDNMFLWAAGLAFAALIVAAITTNNNRTRVTRRRVPVVRVIRKYQHGLTLFVALVMGIGLSLPCVLLRPYTQMLEIERIGLFFAAYAVTAFVIRIATRRMPERVGVRAMTFSALALMAVSMLLYLVVFNAWLLLVPAIAAGAAHGLCFPAIVGAGSAAFPRQFRGLGTTVMLAMFDIGWLVGPPLLTGILKISPFYSLPPYPTMFVTCALFFAISAIVYGILSREKQAVDCGRV